MYSFLLTQFSIIKSRGRVMASRVLASLVLILMATGGFTQVKSDWKSQLKDQLESDMKVEYLHLVGYFDDHLYADMYFAYDNMDWAGILSFPDSDLFFNLDGFTKKDQVFFNEYDQEGMLTGHWTLQKEMNQYVVKWQNPSGSMDFEFVMYDEFWNPDYKKDYHQLFQTYSGKFKDKRIEFEIVRHQFNPTNMRWLDMENFMKQVTAWECQDVFCKRYNLNVEPSNIQDPVIQLQAVESKGQLTFTPVDNSGGQVNFMLDNERKTLLKTRLSLLDKIVVEYPVIINKKGAKVIEKISDRILDTLFSQLPEYHDDSERVESRWSNYAHAWFEVFYWDENYLSGKWVIQRNWTEDQWSVPVNFDINEALFFDIEDQFVRDFDFNYFLDHFVTTGIRELPEYRDLLIRTKLTQASFDHLNFCPTGLVLSTDFDTMFGSFKLMLPFPEIEPYFRKRGILAKILESKKND